MNPQLEPLALSLDKITKSRGVDVVIECTGAPEPTAEVFSLVGRGGKILVLGICEEQVQADFMTGILKELTIDFSYLGYSEFPEAIELISSGRIDVAPLITRIINLENLVDEGFQALSNPDCKDVKVLVEI